MSLIEIILLGISLSMDAFAVSIATGISLKDLRFRHAAKVGLFFGGFQFLMPVLGYWAGSQVSSYIESFDHWIAFGLLAIIGGKMLIESIRPNEKEEYVDPTATGKLFILAIATSTGGGRQPCVDRCEHLVLFHVDWLDYFLAFGSWCHDGEEDGGEVSEGRRHRGRHCADPNRCKNSSGASWNFRLKKCHAA